MDEIKKILSALSKEELVSLCASLLFQTLVNVANLDKLINELEKK